MFHSQDIYVFEKLQFQARFQTSIMCCLRSSNSSSNYCKTVVIMKSPQSNKIKLLTRLRLGSSHLSNHNLVIYSKILKYFCSWGDDIKSTYSYILCGPQYSYDTITLINKIRDINKDILNQNNKLLAWALIFGDSELSRFTVLKS